MELIKESKPLEFVWKDVTFLVRAQATASDKFNLDMSIMSTRSENGNTPLDSQGKAVANMREAYCTLFKNFVIGWRGVTVEGKEISYSFENAMLLPADPKDDVILRLGAFIAEKTGIMGLGEEAKNA